MVRVIELQAIQARLVGLEAQLAARRAPFDAFGAYAEVVLAEAREETKH
jgi:hypothetical protein